MERVQVLIDKLVRQRQQNESIDQLLATVQLLQNELLLLKRKGETSGTSKIAVIMPSRGGATAVQLPEKKVGGEKITEPTTTLPQTENKEQPAPVVQPPETAQSAAPQPRKEEYVLQKPRVSEVQPEAQAPAQTGLPAETAPPRPQPVPEPEPVRNMPFDLFQTHFDAVAETPTLAQQEPQKETNEAKEIHELISEPQESLNDKLKEEKTELAHKLKDTPIKDLRKAIGVNDKYVFVNELFRGDEAMYERSIKTINSFHILPEAEYWINRELKFKLGWSDQKETVQYFYHLVRRRFS